MYPFCSHAQAKSASHWNNKGILFVLQVFQQFRRAQHPDDRAAKFAVQSRSPHEFHEANALARVLK
jgi:hypothetical protein